TRDQLLRLIFLPGFSTRAQVTETSGRGIGLDVLRATVEGLNGRVKVRSEHGKGTTIGVEVPVSLATSRSLIVNRGGRRYGVRLMAAARLVPLAPTSIEIVAGRSTIVVGGERVPLADLAGTFRLRVAGAPRQAVVVEVGCVKVALGVDAIEQE